MERSVTKKQALQSLGHSEIKYASYSIKIVEQRI